MADWTKTYEISRANRAGYATKFQIWEYIDTTPALKKLPLSGTIPIIEFNAPEYGIGVMNYRVTVSLLNNYDGMNFAELIRTSETGKLKFVINVQTGASTVFEAFSGFVDTRYFEEYLSGGIELIDVDFISGLAANRDIPKLSAARTDLADLIEFINDDYANINTMFYQITKKLTGYGDHVLYAFSNLAFENWRYYQYGGTSNIPDPNVVFNEMNIDITSAGSPFADDDTIEKIINDLCTTFLGVFGYSPLYQELCFHHFLLGRDGEDYTIIEKGPNGLTDLTDSTHSIVTVNKNDFFRAPKPSKIAYNPIAAISVSREGFEALPEHPTTAAYENDVIENQFMLEGIDVAIKSNFASLQYTIATADDPIGSPYDPPGRIIDNNVGTGLLDIVEQIAIWYAILFFTSRNGLKGKINRFLDPMFPFIYDEDGTVHRLITGQQDPVNLTTEFESIDISLISE